MKPTTTTPRSTIPCYDADGTSLGYRLLAAAQRLVASGHVRPAYGRKGHLKAIWLLQEDGGNPVQSHAHAGTRYSYIESLETGRCWQLRRLDRRGTTTADGVPTNPRDPFFQVVRECMAAPSSAVLATTSTEPTTVQPTAAQTNVTPANVTPGERTPASLTAANVTRDRQSVRP